MCANENANELGGRKLHFLDKMIDYSEIFYDVSDKINNFFFSLSDRFIV